MLFMANQQSQYITNISLCKNAFFSIQFQSLRDWTFNIYSAVPLCFSLSWILNLLLTLCRVSKRSAVTVCPCFESRVITFALRLPEQEECLTVAYYVLHISVSCCCCSFPFCHKNLISSWGSAAVAPQQDLCLCAVCVWALLLWGEKMPNHLSGPSLSHKQVPGERTRQHRPQEAFRHWRNVIHRLLQYNTVMGHQAPHLRIFHFSHRFVLAQSPWDSFK